MGAFKVDEILRAQTQVVAGVNYKFTCKVSQGEKSSVIFMEVWKRLDQTYEVSMFSELKITDDFSSVLKSQDLSKKLKNAIVSIQTYYSDEAYEVTYNVQQIRRAF